MTQEAAKAKEMVGKFRGKIKLSNIEAPYPAIFIYEGNELAKECALICVDEILAKHYDDWDEQSEWWTSIKEEIQKL